MYLQQEFEKFCVLQDVVPDGTSIIPTLLHANNKATGTPLSDL